jgi:hypothetical protein
MGQGMVERNERELSHVLYVTEASAQLNGTEGHGTEAGAFISFTRAAHICDCTVMDQSMHMHMYMLFVSSNVWSCSADSSADCVIESNRIELSGRASHWLLMSPSQSAIYRIE